MLLVFSSSVSVQYFARNASDIVLHHFISTYLYTKNPSAIKSKLDNTAIDMQEFNLKLGQYMEIDMKKRILIFQELFFILCMLCYFRL